MWARPAGAAAIASYTRGRGAETRSGRTAPPVDYRDRRAGEYPFLDKEIRANGPTGGCGANVETHDRCEPARAGTATTDRMRVDLDTLDDRPFADPPRRPACDDFRDRTKSQQGAVRARGGLLGRRTGAV